MIAASITSEQNDKHIPVLIDEVIQALSPQKGDVYVDGTFGAGGYSRAVLNSADCTLLAIDRDPDALSRASAFKDAYRERFAMLPGCFGLMDQIVHAQGHDCVNGVMLDIGVSSFQLDEPERGFSFMHDGPLDMRMSVDGLSAADVVNTFAETDIANIIFNLGEERASRRIAAAIVTKRLEAPFTRTRELAKVVESVLGRAKVRKGKKTVHPATRTFQALRIFVNDELGELRRGLDAAEHLLAPEGRLVVVCFHSLEDRIVKSFMAERGGRSPSTSRHLPPDENDGPAPTFELKKKGAIKPSNTEIQRNPRARSSRLRVAVRTNAKPWSEQLRLGNA